MADHHHFSRYASFHLPSAAAAPPPAAIAAAPYDPHHSRIPPAPLPLPLPSQILARPPPPPSGPSPLYEPQEPLFTLIKKPLPIAEFDSRLIQDSRLHQFDCGPPPSSSSRVSIRPFPKGDRPNVDYGDSRPGRWESSGCLPPHNQVSSSEFSAGQYSHITYDRNPAVRYRDRSRIEHESSYRSNRNVYSDRYDCEDYRDRDRNLLNAERSSSSSGYCYPNSNSSSQLRDYAENFGNSESQYSSVSDEYYMDVEEELGQNCRRGRTTTRFEMGSKINRNCDAYWLDSGRRMSHVSESGKYNSRGIREGSREHIRPPRRKAQKKSALERLEEPTSRNWSETSSLLFYGSQPSSYRGKDLPVHSDHRVDERRHGSPVELDVSFKSNVLVAKIAAPSSPSSASYRRSPHRAKKYRKVVTPDRDVSGLPENKLNECPVKSDCITQAAGEPSNSLSELNQSEEAVGFASSETFHDIKSVSCSNEIIASSLKSSVGSEGGAISIGGEAAHVSYDEKSVVKVRKRVKVAESPSCSSELIVINKHDESLSGDGSLCLPSAASGCCTVVTDAKEKLTSSSLVTKNKILSPLSLNEFLDKSDGFPNCISGKNSDDVDADTSFPGKITRRSSSNCLLDSSSPETTKTSENLVNSGLSVDCLRLIPNSGGNALIDIKDSNTGSEFETLISSRLSGHCDTIVQSENSDGKGCSANVILAEGNVDIPLLSPKDISVHKSPIHTHNSSHAMITTVNYVGSLINSNDTVCIPGIGKNREQSNQIELHLPHKDVVSKEFSKAISSEEIGASLVVLNSDCADHSARTAPGSGRGLGNNLEHEPTIGNNVVVDNLNKVLCPGLPTLSPEYDAKHQSLEAKGSLGDDPAIVSNKDDGPCSSKMIVRSLQSDVSDLTSNGTNTGSMIRVNPSNGVDKNSEEDSVLTGCGSLAAGSEPCTVETNTSSVKNFIKQFDRVKYSVSDDVNVSVETLNSCKKKRKSFSPHQVVSAPVSGISDGSQSALHLANGNVMPFNFDAHTTESENEFAVPITGIEHTTFLLYSPLKTENCFEGRSSETSDSAGDGCGRDSLSVDSYSSVPLGLVGEHSEEREKATQVAPAANLQNDIKDRESEVSRDMLQGYLAERMETLLPQDAVLSQMRLSINMDDNCLLPEKHALPSMSRCASLWAHGIKASNSNCDDSADNAVSNTTTQNLSVKTHLPMLYANLPPSDYSSEALSGDDWKIEVTNGGSELPGHEKVSQNSEIAANVASPTKSDDLVLGKSFVLHSQCPKTTESLAHNTEGLNGQKKQMSYVVPRGYTPLASTSLKKAVFSNSVARPRTWHRTVDPSLSLLPGKVSSAPLPSPRQSQAETKRPPSTSYIRKGNSLVRKSASATSFSQNSHGLSSSVYRLNASSSDKVKHNGSDSRVDMVEPLKIGENCHSGRPLSPPSQQNTNLSTCISTLSGDHMSSVQASSHQDDSSEKMSHGPKLSESKDTPKSSEDALKNIVYVKCNSNQLIATSNASNTSTHDENKTHVLPSDGYYKRNNNQLIRTSVENDSLPTVFLPGDGSTSEEQRASKAFSSKGLNKRRSEFFVKKLKPSKSSLVWTLGGSQLLKSSGYSSECKAVLPHLFPWKRKAYLRRSLHNLPSDSSSLSMIGRKLLHLRKRDTIYTRSYCGFSLRKSKVLSVGGANLKWSKSIERRSKKANEEATIAVAEAERKKRQQRGDACVPSRRRSRNQSSRERIFRIGLDRYKMDSSRRTLQRISDDKPCPVPVQPENKLKSSYVPRRLLIGNNEYVRVGNGNQLIRDPKKRTRALASEKVRWSLHTARLRLAKKRKYCQFYTRFGKCNKDSGRCPYIHDPSKIAVCTKFLNGLCSNANCKLTHKVIPERMQDCSYFLQGLCSNEQCPYRHVNVNPNASVCEGFLKGYCADGDECRKKHSYVCPDYEATGVCPRESNCKLHHPKKRSKGKKRKQSEGMNARGRYFGYIHMNNAEAVVTVNDRHDMLGSDDIFYKDGKFADYISLDVSDEEAGESYAIMSEQTITSDNIPSVVESDDLDHLIKPIRIMENHLGVQPSELQAAF